MVSRFTNIIVEDCGGDGIQIVGNEDVILTNVSSNRNGGVGISISSDANITLDTVEARRNAREGIVIKGAPLYKSLGISPEVPPEVLMKLLSSVLDELKAGRVPTKETARKSGVYDYLSAGSDGATIVEFISKIDMPTTLEYLRSVWEMIQAKF